MSTEEIGDQKKSKTCQRSLWMILSIVVGDSTWILAAERKESYYDDLVTFNVSLSFQVILKRKQRILTIMHSYILLFEDSLYFIFS